MKLLKLLIGIKEQKKELTDKYQLALNKVGREQFVKLLDKGLQMPIKVSVAG